MNWWIWGTCIVFLLYFAAAMLWDSRGAIACFAVTPIIWLALFCSIWGSDTAFWGRKWKTLDWIYSLATATGLGSILTWFVGVFAVALGLGLGRKIKSRIS
jgi:hypothetical protein